MPSKADEKTGFASAGGTDRRDVLLIDDDLAVLLAYRKLFSRLGIGIDTADTIEAARERLGQTTYRVVIADLSLTGMIGQEGLEIIRFVRDTCPETKAILITAYGSHGLIEKAYELGVSFYFEKPVPLKTLQEALGHLGVR